MRSTTYGPASFAAIPLLLAVHLILILTLPLLAFLGFAQVTPGHIAVTTSRWLSMIGIFLYCRCVIAWPLMTRGPGQLPAQPFRFAASVVQCAIPLGLLYYFFGDFRSAWQVLDLSWFSLTAIVLALCLLQATNNANAFAFSLFINVVLNVYLFSDALGPFQTAWEFLPASPSYYWFKPAVSALLISFATLSLPSRGYLARRYGLRAAALGIGTVGGSAIFLPGTQIAPPTFVLVFFVLAYFLHRRTAFAENVVRLLAPIVAGACLSLVVVAWISAENSLRGQVEIFFLTSGVIFSMAAARSAASASVLINENQSVTGQAEAI